MAKRSPHAVLGVAPGASQAVIKAAWRRLARENHPDLTAGDPTAAAAATRRMAEINAAYEELRRDAAARRGGVHAGDEEHAEPAYGFGGTGRARAGGPPRPRPSRPVTGRVDTSGTFRPRNQTVGNGGPSVGRVFTTGPIPRASATREAPRASDPTGPLHRGRVHRFRTPEPPPLEVARQKEMVFGKFRGHTLGEIADFEPSYLDWIASTITRDPELVAAARVLCDDLDQRGIARTRRSVRRDTDDLRSEAAGGV